MTNLGKLIETADGSLSLIHPDHDECYHSYGGALWEAQSLYCKASGILERLNTAQGIIRVCDVGLGLAYNACSTIDASFQSGGSSNLEIHSLEINADLVTALASLEGAWQENWPKHWKEWCSGLNAEGQGKLFQVKIAHPTNPEAYCHWHIHIGDGVSTIEDLNKQVTAPWDYIWQDPFSPEKNPRMWNQDWFALLRENSNQNTQLLTYSVARIVKNALLGSVWIYEKVKATVPMKHWLRANLPC